MYRPLPKCFTIKESNIEGLGLFATEDIPKETCLGVSHVVTYLDEDIIRTGIGAFYNHSETPNCEKRKSTVGLSKRWYLYTIRDIKAGEEITVKYTMYKI